MTSLADDTPAAGECGMRDESALGHPDTPEAPCGPEILRAAAKRAAQASAPSRIGCGGCDNRWTGLRACHCSACHRTFTGIRGFDIRF